MTRPQMWVCSERFGTWILCPASPMEFSSSGQSNVSELLNGGAYSSRSVGTHRTASLSWMGKTADLQPIKSLYEGLYGDGPFYFIDPAITQNVLPPHWAAPALSGNKRWPALVRKEDPILFDNPALYGLPIRGASYNVPDEALTFDRKTPRATIPIPPGSTLRLCAWGSATGSGVLKVNLYDRTTDALTVVNLVPAAGGQVKYLSGAEPSSGSATYPSTTLYPSITFYPAASTVAYTGPYYSRAEIWISKLGPDISSVSLNGLTAQIDNTTANWFPGEGTNGLQFTGDLGNTTYRAKGGGWKAMSATMVEVGSWLQ